MIFVGVSLHGWNVSVEDLRLARDTGELTAAAFELFARLCRLHLPPGVRLANPFLCQAEKLQRGSRARMQGLRCVILSGRRRRTFGLATL